MTPAWLADWLADHTIARILLTAFVAHAAVVVLGVITRSSLLSKMTRTTEKTRTILGLAHSIAAFVIYFIAVGYILSSLGVDLSAYIASASVIALAVGFGSQGVVQDVVTGITLVFADLFDVGEMIEIGGQTGIVRHVGMRFTTIQNYMGGLVYIPNRSITNVINYPDGYVRVLIDVRIPSGSDTERLVHTTHESIEAVSDRYPRLFRKPPVRIARDDGVIRFAAIVWPGQNAMVETLIKAALLPELKEAHPDYPDTGLAMAWEADRITLLPTARDRRLRSR